MPTSETTDSICGPSSQSKNRAHATRTSLKESCSSTIENNECDSTINILEKDQKILPCPRYSNRAPKRLRKDSSPGENSSKKSVVTLKPHDQLTSRTRRPWELWSVEDKNAFFEALCEYGKDFESIQGYIAQRSKKKGIPTNMIKNKDQVRHFYYRTWHKISKYLEIGDEVRKQTQEIYGLINYAELRKKIGSCLSEKNSHKLNELVFNGVTTVKYKGKKLRIKTPVCRALKKLSNVTETKEPEIEKLPKDIILELRPHNNQAWLHVQNLAQNPRVRTKVSLQCRLKSVIGYLQNKWKPSRLKRKEQMLSSCAQPAGSFFVEDPVPTLYVKPCNSTFVKNVSISVLDSASSSDVCLEKYLKVSREPASDKETTKRKPRPKLKTTLDNESLGKTEENVSGKMSEDETPEISTTDCDPNSDDNYNINLLTPPKSVEEEEECCESVIDEAQRSLSLLSSMLDSANSETPAREQTTMTVMSPKSKSDDKQSSFNCTTIEEMYLNKCQESESLTLGQILSLSANPAQCSSSQTCTGTRNSTEELTSSTKAPNSDIALTTESQNKTNESESSVKEFKTRWTVHNAGLLTIGELYLMLGQPSKVVLEYAFDFSKHESEEDALAKTDSDNHTSPPVEELADVMRKLIEVASSTFSEFKSKQTSLLPSCKSGSPLHITSSSSSSNKSNPRCITKSTNPKALKAVKSSNIGSKSGSDGLSALDGASGKGDSHSSDDLCSTTSCLKDGVQSTSDNHVFVVPVGTAPRVVKKPTQESLQEELDKLLPGTRRGCRVRRKPLVVQRPLLPRDGSVTGTRPMTVVHLVPSASQITAVIPPTSCAATNSKANTLPPKQIVEVRTAPGPAIAPCPLQVPLIKGMNHDPGILLSKQPVEAHLIMGSAKQNASYQNVTTVIDSLEKRPIMITSTANSSVNIHDSTPLSLQSSEIMGAIIFQKNEFLHPAATSQDELITSSPPQISIPDTSPCPTVAAENPTSFLEVSIVSELGTESLKLPEMDHLAASVSAAELSLPSVMNSENTPPQSPPNTVRLCSPGPEAQWLNGESEEFSLNTLLNTLESPTKVMPVSASVNATNENSNSDAITRLAPVVDSEVRCLLEECSVDFIAKFEDLADVINSSNSENKSV